MKVFITGATGWIGSAVVPELIRAGHDVLGLARSDASAAAIAAMGGKTIRGDLGDIAALQNGATQSDGVIHLAFIHDFQRFDASVEADARALKAIGSALEGTGKPLVFASGTPAVPGRLATELDDPEAAGPTASRAITAKVALGYAERGVRCVEVRLPRSVHGDGDRHGFVPILIAADREKGVSGYVGNGSSRWPAVHVLDAARLFRLALENAPAGSVLHAVGDEGVTVRDIAEVIGRRLDLPVASLPPEGFGFLGGVFAVDQPASSQLTRDLLDWRPVQSGLLEDLEAQHYYGA